MRDNWKPISEFAKIRRGASPRPIGDPSYFGGNVGWVKISDVTSSSKFLKKTKLYLSKLGESRSLRVDKGDLVMSICGTIGRPIIVDIPACIHDGFVQLYDIKNADVEYLYYILQFSEKGLERKGQPGTQVNLNTTIVGDYLIYAPQLPQQQKIAKILATVDTVIEKTETAIAKYQAIKQGLMHNLFTRGIDINTGKLRPIPQEAPELYKDSALGLIPKEWEVKTVDEVAYLRHGYQFRDYDFVDEGIDVIKIGQVGKDGNLNLQKSSKISYSRLEEFKSIQLFEGDVLMALTGATLGKTAIIRGFDKPMVQNYRVGYFEPKNIDVLNKLFLYYLLIGESVQNEILGFVNAGAQGNIGKADFEKISIVVPSSVDEQKLIANKLSILDSKVQTEQQALAKYQQLKAGLLQDLLTGTVEVIV